MQVRDMRYLELIYNIEERNKRTDKGQDNDVS